MRTILHILTRSDDSLSRDLIEQQRTFTDINIDVVDLAHSEPNYEELVEKIFAADSIEVS